MSFTLAGNSIGDIVLRIAGEKYHTLALIALSWRDVVGSLLSERSTPAKYEFNTLFVRVFNSSWLQELIIIKQDILERLQKKDIPVQEIVFLAGTNRGFQRTKR